MIWVYQGTLKMNSGIETNYYFFVTKCVCGYYAHIYRATEHFTLILLPGGGTVWKYDVFDVSENIAHFGIMPTPKNAIDINTVPP
jgi:hypothetical protein